MLLDILEEKADSLTGLADEGTYNIIMHGYSMFFTIITSTMILYVLHYNN